MSLMGTRILSRAITGSLVRADCGSKSTGGRWTAPSGVVLAPAPRLDLVPHVIHDANGLRPFGPAQRSRELPDPRFEGLQVGRELRSAAHRFRATVALPAADEAELEDHAVSSAVRACSAHRLVAILGRRLFNEAEDRRRRRVPPDHLTLADFAESAPVEDCQVLPDRDRIERAAVRAAVR